MLNKIKKFSTVKSKNNSIENCTLNFFNQRFSEKKRNHIGKL
jgi:hypothetical protein